MSVRDGMIDLSKVRLVVIIAALLLSPLPLRTLKPVKRSNLEGESASDVRSRNV